MRLRTKYIVFVALVHLVALTLSYFIFKENTLLFFVSEIVIIISIVISWRLYRELLRPLKLLLQGTEAIKDRDFNVKFVPTGKYEVDQLIDVYNQMIDELRKERISQEQQHHFLGKLISTSPTGIIILDYDERVHQINPKALQLLGINEKEVLGEPLEAIIHPVMQQVKQLPSGQAKTFTFNNALTYKLQKSHFIDRGFPRQFVMIEELTIEILEAEKKTYEKVIRMMAHEVNNTVGPVNSILQSTLQSKERNESIANALQVAIERNSNLNNFMRNFADLVRIPAPVKKPIDIIHLLRKAADLMMLRSGDKKISFLFEFSDPSFIVNADSQLLEQVFINIIKNAQEAIEQEGSIVLVCNNASRQVIIRDNGTGILPLSEEHLFSPFYSTKKDGQGIGLTVIREILVNQGFDFSLKTVRPGQTEFSINF